MLTIDTLAHRAIEDFKDMLANDEWGVEYTANDLIHSIADSHVPNQYWELLELVVDDYSLTAPVWEREGFFWMSTPVQLVMSNVYEYLSTAMKNWYTQNKMKA